MKHIYIIRHAKSSWANLGQIDHDRPLNERGIRDSITMAEKLSNLQNTPTIIISSTANRALATARTFQEKLKISESNFYTTKELYHADIPEIMECINEQDDQTDSIAIFCHNPGITYFANLICDADLENVATSGIVYVTASVSSWQKVESENITFKSYLYPRNANED